MSFTQFHPFKDPFVSDGRLPANKESRFPWISLSGTKNTSIKMVGAQPIETP